MYNGLPKCGWQDLENLPIFFEALRWILYTHMFSFRGWSEKRIWNVAFGNNNDMQVAFVSTSDILPHLSLLHQGKHFGKYETPAAVIRNKLRMAFCSKQINSHVWLQSIKWYVWLGGPHCLKCKHDLCRSGLIVLVWKTVWLLLLVRPVTILFVQAFLEIHALIAFVVLKLWQNGNVLITVLGVWSVELIESLHKLAAHLGIAPWFIWIVKLDFTPRIGQWWFVECLL